MRHGAGGSRARPASTPKRALRATVVGGSVYLGATGIPRMMYGTVPNFGPPLCRHNTVYPQNVDRLPCPSEDLERWSARRPRSHTQHYFMQTVLSPQPNALYRKGGISSPVPPQVIPAASRTLEKTVSSCQ